MWPAELQNILILLYVLQKLDKVVDHKRDTGQTPEKSRQIRSQRTWR